MHARLILPDADVDEEPGPETGNGIIWSKGFPLRITMPVHFFDFFGVDGCCPHGTAGTAAREEESGTLWQHAASTIAVCMMVKTKRGHAFLEIMLLPTSEPMIASPGARLCPLGRPGPA